MGTTAIAAVQKPRGVLQRSRPETVAMMLLIAVCALLGTAQAQVGSSGIVKADGRNEQFSQAFAEDILFSGPAGIITKSGVNRQLTPAEATLSVMLLLWSDLLESYTLMEDPSSSLRHRLIMPQWSVPLVLSIKMVTMSNSAINAQLRLRKTLWGPQASSTPMEPSPSSLPTRWLTP